MDTTQRLHGLKVSIVIPYYNGEKWVGKCLDSLLMQDLQTDEYESNCSVNPVIAV